MKIQNIIWDWNGTLLNDVEYCYQIVSQLALQNSVPPFTIQEYLDSFGFPVEGYYRSLGFTFEKKSFSQISGDFIDLYLKNIDTIRPYPLAQQTLKICQSQYRQFLFSAYQDKRLQELVQTIGLNSFFDKIQGISNDLAESKQNLFKNIFQEISPKSTLMVGDTLHDAEIAASYNSNCILISHGHQNHQRLKENVHNFEVVRDYKELLKLIN